MKIKQKSISQEIEINLNNDLTNLPKEIMQAIKLSLKYLSELLAS